MKDFIKMFVASLLAIGAIGFFCFMVFMIFVASAGETVSVPSNAMLVLDLSKGISDKPPTSDFEQMAQQLSGQGTDNVVPLRDVLESIKNAAEDSRIQGIYLTGNVNREKGHSGWGTLSEVRRALETFAQSGKPIYAYNMAWDEASLFLGSVATDLIMNPYGLVQINGFAAELPYMKGALDKFGFEVQVTRVGKYKSAVEPFILDKMSEPNREQTQKYLGDMFGVFVEKFAEARNLEVQAVQNFADTKAIAVGEEAVKAGFVDRLAYFDEVLDMLKEKTGITSATKTFKQVDLQDYITAMGPDHGSRANKIAVIYAEGEIVNGNSEEKVGGATIARLLRKARLDDKVKAVVLRVNSPGGSASASEVIQRETRLIKQVKPLIISMGSVAASGGYWISAYGDKIFAENNTITGSIGVFGMFFNMKRLLNEHLGVNIETVKTAELADLGTMTRPKTEAELVVFQDLVDQIYNSFISKVAEGRGLDPAKVREIAQGRVWSGQEALKLGLVDAIGGIEDAIAEAAQKADVEDFSVIQYQMKKEFFQKLMEEMGVKPPQANTAGLVEQEMNHLETMVDSFKALNDPRGVYARMPFEWGVPQ